MLRDSPHTVEVLKKVDLFSGLNQQQLDDVANHVEEMRVQAGEVLVSQGEYGHECAVLIEGTVRVERDGTVLAHLGPGDFFGEMSLLDGKPRSASIIAETPSALLVIHGRDFRYLLDTVPGLARMMLIEVVDRLRALEEHFIS